MSPEGLIQYRKALLTDEGWSFPFDVIGGVKHYRAVKDGWISVFDIHCTNEETAVNRAWEHRNALVEAQNPIIVWLKAYPQQAGIVYDDIENKFVATLSLKNAPLMEAMGETPLAAVEKWNQLWNK